MFFLASDATFQTDAGDFNRLDGLVVALLLLVGSEWVGLGRGGDVDAVYVDAGGALVMVQLG